MWSVFSNAFGQALHDGCIDVEQVITGHAWLSRHTSWNHHQVGAFERSGQCGGVLFGRGQKGLGDGTGVDVAQVSANTGHIDNVKKRQFRHLRIELEQKRQGLANSTSGAANCNFHHVDLGEK